MFVKLQTACLGSLPSFETQDIGRGIDACTLCCFGLEPDKSDTARQLCLVKIVLMAMLSVCLLGMSTLRLPKLKMIVTWLQARFSTFVWVEAVKLVMIAAASKDLCAAHVDAAVSLQHCTSLVLASQYVVACVLAGGYVWCLDKQARRRFVHGRLRQPT